MDELDPMALRQAQEMNTLAILGRVHRQFTSLHGAFIPYESNEYKKVVVIGLAHDLADSSVNHMAALTCETPEEVHRMLRQWRGFDAETRDAWRRIVSD